MADIYSRVSELETKMVSVETNLTNLATAIEGITPEQDTGWLNLPLQGNVIPYGEGVNYPQYRKIGNTVYLKGAVKNITGFGTVVAILPEGFRPSNGHPFVQSTSHDNNIGVFARWNISSNGTMTMNYISNNNEFSDNDWYPITTNFLVN